MSNENVVSVDIVVIQERIRHLQSLPNPSPEQLLELTELSGNTGRILDPDIAGEVSNMLQPYHYA